MHSQGHVVKRSPSGLGLFATAAHQKGECIIEYIGERISTEEADRRGGKYLFILNKNWVIDGKPRYNTARYMNHSCKPNCKAEVNDAETRIFVYAKRGIRIGEELTFNYGKAYFTDLIGGKQKCLCTHCIETRNTISTK
jgi:uncharacterized protein